jgi:hypothetical protein
MKLEDIKIPDRLISTPPKLDKVLDHHADYINNGYLDPIIVDTDNTIIDGYISYLIHKHYGHETVLVYRITVNAD